MKKSKPKSELEALFQLVAEERATPIQTSPNPSDTKKSNSKTKYKNELEALFQQIKDTKCSATLIFYEPSPPRCPYCLSSVDAFYYDDDDDGYCFCNNCKAIWNRYNYDY